MTPENKANEMHMWYSIQISLETVQEKNVLAKQCAIKCCEEVLGQLCEEYNNDMGSIQKDNWLLKRIDYWKSVIESIKQIKQ